MGVLERLLVILGDKRVLRSLMWTISAIVVVVLGFTDAKQLDEMPLSILLLVIAALFGLRWFAAASPNLIGTFLHVNKEIRQSDEDAAIEPKDNPSALLQEQTSELEREDDR